MFVELHMIQNFAPSNLNRDDTNNPKDCEFGGVRRARISSQCIKRAIRKEAVFTDTTGRPLGWRTKCMKDLLRDALTDTGIDNEEAEVVAYCATKSYASQKYEDSAMDSKKPGQTSVVQFLAPAEIEYLASELLAEWDTIAETIVLNKDGQPKQNKTINNIVKNMGRLSYYPDLALFGRMLAGNPRFQVDAACQVAHAISTHRVTMEMDFFTAVDDLSPEDTAGAGMMGFTGFDSSCFYRYARVDWGQLVSNLNGDAGLAQRTLEGFLRASVAAVPTGKQNSFAAQNPPSLVLGVVRDDGMGWSLANAFEKPVSASRAGGLVGPSINALDAYWGRLTDVYGRGTLTRTAVVALDPDIELNALKSDQVATLEDWIQTVLAALPAEEA